MSIKTPNEPGDNFKIPAKQEKPEPAKPEVWKKHETPGFEINEKGQLRTNIPPPKL